MIFKRMSGKDLHRMSKENNKQTNPDNLSGVNGVFKDMSGESEIIPKRRTRISELSGLLFSVTAISFDYNKA